MANNKESGDIGEQEVVDLVPCPNCGKKLMVLPPNYPMYDVQCTACNFRAQVKTNNCKPKNEIFGATYGIYKKVLKAGYLAPPLIANFKWQKNGLNKQKIKFFPFVGKDNIKVRTLSADAKRANLKMFNYVNLDQLPSKVIFEV